MTDLIEKLEDLIKGKLHGTLEEHEDILEAFKEEKLYFKGDEKETIRRFIPEARTVLNKLNVMNKGIYK